VTADVRAVHLRRTNRLASLQRPGRLIFDTVYAYDSGQRALPTPQVRASPRVRPENRITRVANSIAETYATSSGTTASGALAKYRAGNNLCIPFTYDTRYRRDAERRRARAQLHLRQGQQREDHHGPAPR
jgi:hypothetical protein